MDSLKGKRGLSPSTPDFANYGLDAPRPALKKFDISPARRVPAHRPHRARSRSMPVFESPNTESHRPAGEKTESIPPSENLYRRFDRPQSSRQNEAENKRTLDKKRLHPPRSRTLERGLWYRGGSGKQEPELPWLRAGAEHYAAAGQMQPFEPSSNPFAPRAHPYMPISTAALGPYTGGYLGYPPSFQPPFHSRPPDDAQNLQDFKFRQTLQRLEAWTVTYDDLQPSSDSDGGSIRRGRRNGSSSHKRVQSPASIFAHAQVAQQHVSQEDIGILVEKLNREARVTEKIMQYSADEWSVMTALVQTKVDTEGDVRFEWLLDQLDTSNVRQRRKEKSSVLLCLKRTPKAAANLDELMREKASMRGPRTEGYFPPFKHSQGNKMKQTPPAIIENRDETAVRTWDHLYKPEHEASTRKPIPAFVESDSSTSGSSYSSAENSTDVDDTWDPAYWSDLDHEFDPTFAQRRWPRRDFENSTRNVVRVRQPDISIPPPGRQNIPKIPVSPDRRGTTGRQITLNKPMLMPAFQKYTSISVRPDTEERTRTTSVVVNVSGDEKSQQPEERRKKDASTADAAEQPLLNPEGVEKPVDVAEGHKSMPVSCESNECKTQDYSDNVRQSSASKKSPKSVKVVTPPPATGNAVGETTAAIEVSVLASLPVVEQVSYASGRDPRPYFNSNIRQRNNTGIRTHAARGTETGPILPIHTRAICEAPAQQGDNAHPPTESNPPTDPRHAQGDENRGPPPSGGDNETHPARRRRKPVGYGLSLSYAFAGIGFIAGCIQSIAVYKRHKDALEVNYVLPTTDDTDFFEGVAGNCWLLVGLLFSFQLTIKHGSESNDYGRWVWVWLFTAVSLAMCFVSVSTYLISTALSQALSGAGSAFQMLVYFLTIRILEKGELESVGDADAFKRSREDLNNELDRHELWCKRRRAELSKEINDLVDQRQAVLMIREHVDSASQDDRSRFRDSAMGSISDGSRRSEEAVESRDQGSAELDHDGSSSPTRAEPSEVLREEGGFAEPEGHDVQQPDAA